MSGPSPDRATRRRRPLASIVCWSTSMSMTTSSRPSQGAGLSLRTARLSLRPWREADRDTFAALNADPEVAWDLGGPLTRAASDAKLDRYRTTFARHGFSRLAIEDGSGRFLGYAGVMPSRQNH